MKRSPLKRKTPLNKQSNKRRNENRFYTALRIAFLEKRPYCEIFEPCCTRKSTQIHHMNHREGKRLLDMQWWLPSCAPCHRFIHDHPKYAREAGFLV